MERTNVHESLFECPRSRSPPMRDVDSTKAGCGVVLECPRIVIFHFTIEEIIDDLRFLFLHMRELVPNWLCRYLRCLWDIERYNHRTNPQRRCVAVVALIVVSFPRNFERLPGHRRYIRRHNDRPVSRAAECSNKRNQQYRKWCLKRERESEDESNGNTLCTMMRIFTPVAGLCRWRIISVFLWLWSLLGFGS